MAPRPPLSRSLRRTVQRSPPMGNGDLTVCMVPPISGRDVYGMGRPSGGVCMTGATEGTSRRLSIVAEPQSLRLRPHAAPAIAASLAISVTRPGMIAHRIDWQRGGSRIAFADSHGAPSHPYAQRSSSRRPTRCAIVALRPRMCRTLRSDKELTLRADSARSLATDVRPLPGAFLPFRQRSLSAQLRRPRPQSATSAIRRFC